MSVDLAKAVGYRSKELPVRVCWLTFSILALKLLQVSWNKRDLLAYAVGVGAKASDLPLVYGAFFLAVACDLTLKHSMNYRDRAWSETIYAELVIVS